MSMFNLGALAANVLNSLDNAAKDTLEEPRVSATALRNQRLNANNPDLETNPSDDEENDHPEPERPREVIFIFSLCCFV